MLNNSTKAPSGWLPFLRSLANDSKLKFVIGRGVGPATDGNTVWLPEMPASLYEDDLTLFKGHSFHEVGHIRSSNIVLFQEFSKKHGETAQFILNALDDVFMEGVMSKWKRMAEQYLRGAKSVLVKRNQYRDGSESLAEAVGCFCLTYLTAKRWDEIQPAVEVVTVNLKHHLGEHADRSIKELIDLLDAEFPAVKSTSDCADLTLKVIQLFKDLAEQTPSESESKPSDGTGEPNDQAKGSGNAQESGEDGNGDAPKESKDSMGSDTKPESKEGSEKTDAGSAGTEGVDIDTDSDKGNSSDKPSDQNGKSLKELVEEMLNAKPGSQEVFDKAIALEKLSKTIARGSNQDYADQPTVDQLVIEGGSIAGTSKDFVEGMCVVEGDKEMAKVISEITGRKANVMANKLRALLVNREETDMYSCRNGRLCEKNLYRFALDDSRIFEASEERIEETAAVSITADLSGSTVRSKDGTSIAEQIRIALTILEKVLNEIGTPREIQGFAPNSDQLTCMVRSFGDNTRVALERIAGLHRLVGGGSTPIGQAVFQAGTRLLSHDAQRKLLFVLTDGSPSSQGHAVEMTDYVVKGGVEVIYLVIGRKENCEWLERNNIKFAHAESAFDLIPSLVSKVGEFMA